MQPWEQFEISNADSQTTTSLPSVLSHFSIVMERCGGSLHSLLLKEDTTGTNIYIYIYICIYITYYKNKHTSVVLVVCIVIHICISILMHIIMFLHISIILAGQIWFDVSSQPPPISHLHSCNNQTEVHNVIHKLAEKLILKMFKLHESGVIHNDIKPGNILYNLDASTIDIKETKIKETKIQKVHCIYLYLYLSCIFNSYFYFSINFVNLLIYIF